MPIKKSLKQYRACSLKGLNSIGLEGSISIVVRFLIRENVRAIQQKDNDFAMVKTQEKGERKGAEAQSYFFADFLGQIAETTFNLSTLQPVKYMS